MCVCVCVCVWGCVCVCVCVCGEWQERRGEVGNMFCETQTRHISMPCCFALLLRSVDAFCCHALLLCPIITVSWNTPPSLSCCICTLLSCSLLGSVDTVCHIHSDSALPFYVHCYAVFVGCCHACYHALLMHSLAFPGGTQMEMEILRHLNLPPSATPEPLRFQNFIYLTQVLTVPTVILLTCTCFVMPSQTQVKCVYVSEMSDTNWSKFETEWLNAIGLVCFTHMFLHACTNLC